MHVDADSAAADLRRLQVVSVQTVGSVSELDAVPGVCRLEAREPNALSFLAAPKEVRERAVQTFERGIYGNGGQVGVFFGPVPLVLLEQVYVLARRFLVFHEFFQGGVIETACGNEKSHQLCFLFLVRAQPVFVSPHHSGTVPYF